MKKGKEKGSLQNSRLPFVSLKMKRALVFFDELILADAAERTFVILGQIFESDTVVFFGIVDVSADFTDIFHRWSPFNGQKAAGPDGRLSRYFVTSFLRTSGLSPGSSNRSFRPASLLAVV